MKNYTPLIVLALLVSVPFFAYAQVDTDSESSSFFSSIFPSKTKTTPSVATPPVKPSTDTSTKQPSQPEVSQTTIPSITDAEKKLQEQRQNTEIKLREIREKLYKEAEPERQALEKKLHEQRKNTETKIREMREKLYKEAEPDRKALEKKIQEQRQNT